MDVPPEDRSLLPKYNSDVCKWHLFFSNLTEDVFQVVKDTFALDYARKLKFQCLPEEEEVPTQGPASIAIPDNDEIIKVFAQFLFFLHMHQTFIPLFPLLFQKELIISWQFVQRGRLFAKFSLELFF